MEIRVLSAPDIEQAVSAAAAVDAMRVAFGELSGGQAVVPVRGHIESAKGLSLFMPAYLSASHGLGAKIVSVFPENPSSGEPPIQGAIFLLDPDTGALKAVLDGTSLTEIRTAAGSGLATEVLADPAADVLTVFGAGAQARSHIRLLAASRLLADVRLVSRSYDSAVALAASLSAEAEGLCPPGSTGRPPVVRAMETSAEALEGAGLVVTATTSTEPVFGADELQPGAHVNAVGAFRPEMQEVPPEVVLRSRVVVDQREAIWEEAGDLIKPVDAGLAGREIIDAELGEIVNGAAPKGRGEHDYTLFKSVGNAAQDVAIAVAALALAEAQDLGSLVPF